MHTLEALQCAQRRSGNSIVSHIKLRHFVSGNAASIGNVGGDRHRTVSRNTLFIDLQVAVGKRCVAQSIAEGIESFPLEISVRAVRHRVILEWWELQGRFVEGHRQPATGTEVACKGFRDRSSTLSTGIPGLQNRRNIMISPIYR